MKTTISLPDDLYWDAERLSKRKQVSRSALYANAIRGYVQKEAGLGITEQLNTVYRAQVEADIAVERAGIADLGRKDW